MDESIVWMVPIGRGEPKESKGLLSLEDRLLVFTGQPPGERVEIPLSQIRKVRRVRGSPILMVTLESRTNVAFYFAQPPPLRPSQVTPGTDRGRIPSPFAALGGGGPGGATKKKVIRANLSYLSSAAADKKKEIEGWLRAIRDTTRGK